jgi:hypothetical protein
MVAALEAVLSTGTSYMVRFTATGIDVYDGNVWTPATGLAWSTTNDSDFGLSAWADNLMFSNEHGIFNLSFGSGFPVTSLNSSILDAIHLATFGGRAIATRTSGSVQWSVKDDNTDWAGLGSGYEDSRSAPGGRLDRPTAVVPVTDELALVVRTGSIWQMQLTGNYNAPFSFSQIVAGPGTQYPRTVAAIPYGTIFVGYGSVWKYTLNNGLQQIGLPIESDLLIPPSQLRRCVATYEPKWNEYRLTISSDDPNQGKVLRYNIDGDFWTEDVYPFPIRSIAYTLFVQGVTIDELVGAIDQLTGTVDDLTTGIPQPSIVLAQGDPSRYVVQESSPHNSDAMRDVSTSGGQTYSGWSISTGLLDKANALKTKHVNLLELAYTAAQDTDIQFWYSDDGGDTWNLIDTITAVATNKPKVLRVDLNLDRDQLMFAASTAATPNMKLISLLAHSSTEGDIVDAAS